MATNKLIDLSRLSRFWDKVKNYIDDKLAPKAFYPTTAKESTSSSAGVNLSFTSDITDDVPVKSLFITIPSSVTGYTSVRFTFNNSEYTIYLDETLNIGGTLDVISGILTRADETTKQLSGINLKASYGENSIYVYDFNDVMVVYYEPYDDHIAAQYYNKTEINRKFANDVYHLKTEGDNRNVATAPNDYVSDFVFKGLKTNTVINSPSSDIYSYLFGLRGWQDSTGGRSYEIAFNNNGIFVRQEGTTTNTWASWNKIPYDSLVQPRIQRTTNNKSFTSSTSLAYTGQSITCPANHVYIVRAWAFYNNSQPLEFYVTNSSTNSLYYARVAGGGTSTSGVSFIMSGGETFYYWAKYAGAYRNEIREFIIDIPY